MTGVASYGYHFVSSIASIPSAGLIKGASADDFIADMLRLGLRYNHFCLNAVEIAITDAELSQHCNASCCYICRISKAKLIVRAIENEEIRAKKFEVEPRATALLPPVLVKDHDHVTGLFRGSACQSCNVKAQMPKQIVVFFHNLEGFDGHELVNAIIRMRTPPQRNDDDDVEDNDIEGEDEAHDSANIFDGPIECDDFATSDINLDQERIANMRFEILANSTDK